MRRRWIQRRSWVFAVAAVGLAVADAPAAHPAWKEAKTVRVIAQQDFGGADFPGVPARRWAKRLLEVWGLRCVGEGDEADVALRVNVQGRAEQATYRPVSPSYPSIPPFTPPFGPRPTPRERTKPKDTIQRFTKAMVKTTVTFMAGGEVVHQYTFSGTAGPFYTIRENQYKSPSDAPFKAAFPESQDKKFWLALYRLRGDVTPLFTALTHRDRGIRLRSAKVLGYVRDGRAVAPLIHALPDGDKEVREAVRTALETLRPAWPKSPEMRDEVPYLITRLRGGTSGARWDLATALGLSGDHRAIPPLVAVLADPAIGGAAAKALAAIDAGWRTSKAATDAVPGLIRRVASGCGSSRKHPARALGWIGDERAGDVLLPLLADTDDGVRRAAIWALGRIGDRRAYQPILRITRTSKSKAERNLAAEALLRIGEPDQAKPATASNGRPTQKQIEFWLAKARSYLQRERYQTCADFCRKVLKHADKDTLTGHEANRMLKQCQHEGAD